MVSSWQKVKSAVMESVYKFVFGAISGGMMAITEQHTNQLITEIILSKTYLDPVIDGMKNIGPLGLSTLLGTTAIITSMTAMIAGIIAAAFMSLFLSEVKNTLRWLASGLAAIFATTLSGVALGAMNEKLSLTYGVVSLLWALFGFTVLKLLILNFIPFKCTPYGILGKEESCKEQERDPVMELEQRQAGLKKKIIACENSDAFREWEVQQTKQIWMQGKAFEFEIKKRTSQRHLIRFLTQYMELLALSGIPMTVIATVTVSFGTFGFGEYRFLFIIQVIVMLSILFGVMRYPRLHFYSMMGCMGMFATFAMAVLTVHAGQEVAGSFVRIRKAGHNVSKENIGKQIAHVSSVRLISSGFFVSELCQLVLGGTVAGQIGRENGEKVTVLMSVVTVLVVKIFSMLSGVLGVGAKAGGCLGSFGASAVSLGGAAAAGVKSSTWGGIVGTTAGMLSGFLVFGDRDFLSVCLQVCVAYAFSNTNLF